MNKKATVVISKEDKKRIRAASRKYLKKQIFSPLSKKEKSKIDQDGADIRQVVHS